MQHLQPLHYLRADCRRAQYACRSPGGRSLRRLRKQLLPDLWFLQASERLQELADLHDGAVENRIRDRGSEEGGFDRSSFDAAFLSPDVRNETFGDFLAAQELGVRGFPTLIAGNEAQGYALVTNGYRPLDGMVDALEKWLASKAQS